MDKMELTKTHIQKEVSTMSLVELFVDVDDFHNRFEGWLQIIGQGKTKPDPKSKLVASEIMTIQINFHCPTIRTSSIITLDMCNNIYGQSWSSQLHMLC